MSEWTGIGAQCKPALSKGAPDRDRALTALDDDPAKPPDGEMTVPDTIAQKPLGRTGLLVSALGFGCAPLGDLYGKLDEATAVDTGVAAVESGMTLVDTSPHYGNGLSEHRVGAVLRRVGRDRVVLSTKVGRWMTPSSKSPMWGGFSGGAPFAPTIDYSYDGTMRSLEQSFLRLGTERIDIALIHDVDRRNHGDAVDERFKEATAGAWKALAQLREQGVLKAIGIGVNETEICMRFAEVCDLDCVLLAGRYSLLEQDALDSFLPLAERRGIGILLGGVFNSGILATGAVKGAKYDYTDAPEPVLERVRRIEAVCKASGVALPVAAVAFARLLPVVSSVVLGGVTPQEVQRNLAGWTTPVPASLWATLKAEGLIREDAPVA
jgi:D-threo-aldose 1-dehydrogenase